MRGLSPIFRIRNDLESVNTWGRQTASRLHLRDFLFTIQYPFVLIILHYLYFDCFYWCFSPLACKPCLISRKNIYWLHTHSQEMEHAVYTKLPRKGRMWHFLKNANCDGFCVGVGVGGGKGKGLGLGKGEEAKRIQEWCHLSARQVPSFACQVRVLHLSDA